MDQNSFALDVNNYIDLSTHQNLKSIYEPNPFDDLLSAMQLPMAVCLGAMVVIVFIVSLIIKKL